MFPDVNPDRYTRLEALKIVLQRFAYRIVWFDTAMAKSFYKIPEKEIKSAVSELVAEGILVVSDSGYLLKSDAEHVLKEFAMKLTEGLEYDHEPLQYLLIDGEFHGASVGHFRNGPYDLNDIVPLWRKGLGGARQ